MPRGDGTGPGGMGPMTGRGAGFCAGYAMPGSMNPVPGRGFGMGFGGGYQRRGLGGGGRGWRQCFHAAGMPRWMRFGASAFPHQNRDPEMEKQALDEQMEALKTKLELLRLRLLKIEADPDSM